MRTRNRWKFIIKHNIRHHHQICFVVVLLKGQDLWNIAWKFDILHLLKPKLKVGVTLNFHWTQSSRTVAISRCRRTLVRHEFARKIFHQWPDFQRTFTFGGVRLQSGGVGVKPSSGKLRRKPKFAICGRQTLVHMQTEGRLLKFNEHGKIRLRALVEVKINLKPKIPAVDIKA